MKEFKVGFIALTKASWATPEIENLRKTALASLKTLPCEIVDGGALTTTAAEASALCAELRKQDVSAVVVFMATFPVGAIIPVIAKELPVPVILISTPEKPQAGKMWTQNSFCGSNMAVHTLRKLGRKNTFVFGPADQAAALVKKPLAVLKCVSDLASAKVGLVGGRVPGFYTSNCDEMRLRAKLGTEVEIIDLLEIVDTANKLSDADVKKGVDAVRKTAAVCCAKVEKDLEAAGKMYESFLKTAKKYNLSAYAVRCWPEWSDIFGIAPCSTIGMLNNDRMVSSCEGDVLGAVLMQMEASLSGGIPFFADLISFDYAANTAVLWHCGAAPSAICRKFEETTLSQHFRVDGGNKKGLTNEFSMKAGPITLAQLDEDGDGYRMLIAKGTALDTEPFIRGNPLNVKFDGAVEKLVGTIMTEGFKHHYSIIHADVEVELIELCRWLDITPVVVK
ncbi:MAG TPA: L-fucose/L-arabinose isomerase family protein [Kiritimatiellia bacterium]|nr:L-fucose/L-arabinose isomerase family protein [Kiritimatiellia bacterium]HPS09276.1 L-fucose/L-arabinose isomerase family protein [Kiritimatiellia bacterium]